ncbi:hypothetical protein Anapl_06245 [Anas platyrhynchos]|uniref:Uncharacterized protein n=1 Tax=Anas platyrhynchos TaxID=8839 RepID=R0LL90_ANAPL|nr:hypothetical protein Anapl_06245 [Anas platyrhynchos]
MGKRLDQQPMYPQYTYYYPHYLQTKGFDPAPQRGGRNTPSREAVLAVPAVRLNLSAPDARVNACKSQKCNFPMLMVRERRAGQANVVLPYFTGCSPGSGPTPFPTPFHSPSSLRYI